MNISLLLGLEHLSKVGCGGCKGQTDRDYKKPVTHMDTKNDTPLGIKHIPEIAIPLGMKRIPDSVN